MQHAEVEITNKHGLHARPANELVKTAKRFASSIWLEAKGKQIDAKNIVKVLSLGAAVGTKIHISAEGPDETDAVSRLTSLFESGFGENLDSRLS
jgi:phosphocarrier protein HPr